jgi:hypothetical protein
MKLRLLSLLLLISGVVHGQTPAGYIKANMRFKWTAGIFDSALHVPQYNGTPSGIRNGAWVGDGAVAVDTVNNLFYFRSSGAWHQTSSGAGWLLTGNSGTTSSNFIGTTDNQPLSFRVNNRWAGRLTTSGNIFWGDSAGVNNIGYSNVAIGRGALRNDVGGINLVAIGDSALYNNLGDVGAEEGLQNTAVGSKALFSNTTGYSNTANGHQSLYSNTTGYSNTANGYQSLYSNTTGSYNTANGLQSLYSNTTGSGNTANGYRSLYSNTTGGGNTANGYRSLYSNTTGSYNTANGLQSLYSNTTGYSNTANGYQSLYSNTTGYSNTANGYQSLYSNTTGNSNTVNGYYSLYSNTTGSYNTANGLQSLYSNTTGDNNVGIGYQSGYHTNQKTDAKNQILIGAGTYGTRDSIAVIGANFMKETILRGKLIDSTLSAGAGTKAVRWNGSTGEFTYADTTVGGGGSPAGSNKELQFNNSGAFGGTTGIKYGNASNERLTIWQTTSTDVPLTIKVEGDNSKAAIEIKDTTGSPYTSAIKFTPSGGGSPGASYIMQGYGSLILSAGTPPYLGSRDALVSIGISSVQNAFFRSYPYDVPDSPNNWVAKIRTAKTSAIGLAIDWGAAGQTGDLLQFRNNSNTVMARFDSIGKLGVNTVPVSYVDANGSLGAAITTTSSNITLDATHHTVIITSGTPTITLPAAASSNARRIYVVVNQTGSAVTISSYQNFSGSGTTTVAANSSIQIQSDGSNWYRIL